MSDEYQALIDCLRDHQNGGRRGECDEAARAIAALRARAVPDGFVPASWLRDAFREGHSSYSSPCVAMHPWGEEFSGSDAEQRMLAASKGEK